MRPEIVKKDEIVLAGFSFFGNPFSSSGEWTEDNEIGRLWKRLMDFVKINPIPGMVPGIGYEMCVEHPETENKECFEVFVGIPVSIETALAPQLCLKILPPSRYARFTLQGKAIVGDWTEQMLSSWLPEAGLQSSGAFNLQYYDHRFKGMENLEESEVDVLIPIDSTDSELSV